MPPDSESKDGDKLENSSTRLLSDRLTLAVCLIFLVRFFAAEIYRIPTHSMVPTLAGPHHRADCPSCGFPFEVVGLPSSSRTSCRCPNCRQEVAPQWKPVTADRAVVLKPQAAKINRFDVVAFKSPDDPRTPFVKRIVGLPGETISVRNGDITRLDRHTGQFEICPKPIDQIFESARMIHDDRHRAAKIPARWRSADDSWQAEANGYRLIKSAGVLTYHHLGPSGQPEPIGDDEPFLSPIPAKETNLVRDVILDLTWHPAHADSEIRINIVGPFSPQTLRVTPKESSLNSHSVSLAPISASSRLRWGRVDGAWLGWQDERFLGRWVDPPFDSSTTYDPTAGIQISIEAADKGSKLTDLVLRRDLHYRAYAWQTKAPTPTDPMLGESTSAWTLNADEFLALGDNTIRSRDSRHWHEGPGLPARLIVGKVVARFSSDRRGWFHPLAGGTEGEVLTRLQAVDPVDEPMAHGTHSRNATR